MTSPKDPRQQQQQQQQKQQKGPHTQQTSHTQQHNPNVRTNDPAAYGRTQQTQVGKTTTQQSQKKKPL